MAWISAKFDKTTGDPGITGIRVVFEDVAVFADIPFVYKRERVNDTPAGRNGFRSAAIAALDAERTKRATQATRETNFLSLLNT